MTEEAVVPADSVPESPAPADSQRAEVESLHRSARLVALVLAVVVVATFVAGQQMLNDGPAFRQLNAVALIGFAGSGTGALTSLLMRYAAGFELESGERSPPSAEGEVYGRRIAFCFLMRPALGILVAPLLVAGFSYFTKDHEQLKDSADAIMVGAFIGGLYAKSALEAAKSAFKIVFRA
jgi:uncharacterized membrane protein AbrB (regulator of aidB expression)